MDFKTKIIPEVHRIALEIIEGAKSDYFDALRGAFAVGRVAEKRLSPYGKSQKKRREDDGLETHTKTLSYSSRLIKSFTEVSRYIGDNEVRVGLGIPRGSAYRRADQLGDGISWQQQADYLSKQQGFGNIIQLSNTDKQRIEDKWGVKISYD